MITAFYIPGYLSRTYCCVFRKVMICNGVIICLKPKFRPKKRNRSRNFCSTQQKNTGIFVIIK